MLSRIRQLLGLKSTIVVIPSALKTPLTARERMEFREWLNTPITQKVLAHMEAGHPGTRLRIPGFARSEWDAHAAVSFLNRVKGWESYRDQLLSIGETPVEAKEPEETYPSQET
jgi:hypothetical protein